MLHYFKNNPLRRWSAQANSRAVLARWRGSETWDRFCSIKEAASQLVLRSSSIGLCCQGVQSSTGGFEFRYADSSPPFLIGEEWRPALHPRVDSRLTTWEVSSFGRVKSSKYAVSSGSRTPAGYRAVNVSMCGQVSWFLVHRLVARAFLGPAPNSERCLVHHKYSDRENNIGDHLEYVTPSENTLYSYRTGRRSTLNKGVRVEARRSRSEQWIAYPSFAEASRRFGVSAECISRC